MRVLVTGGSGFIGTHVISLLEARNCTIANIDLKPPYLDAHRRYWQPTDITETESVDRVMAEFQPTRIVHLAAITSFASPRDRLFAHNAGGTVAVMDAAAKFAPAARVIATSTQLVNEPGAPFDDDTRFRPSTAYGESKVAAEREIRAEKYDALDWLIVRPTNIWGPFHPTYPTQIWKYIRYGLYLHPGDEPIVRAYGYVENVVEQIFLLLTAPPERVRHRVFYVGDRPIDSFLLLSGLSVAFRGKPLRRIPRPLLRTLARCGDGMTWVGMKAPFYTDRFIRMTSEHLGRHESIWQEFGIEPIAMATGIDRTFGWLQRTHPEIYG